MQTRLWISGVVLVLSAGFSVPTATACPRESVAAARQSSGHELIRGHLPRSALARRGFCAVCGVGAAWRTRNAGLSGGANVRVGST
jgi:hypothetical protein